MKLVTIRFICFYKSHRIKTGNFEKGVFFKIDGVQSKTDKETFSSRRTLEKKGTSNDRLLKRDRSPDVFGGYIGSRENRYAETTEQLYRRPRQSAKPRFLLQ